MQRLRATINLKHRVFAAIKSEWHLAKFSSNVLPKAVERRNTRIVRGCFQQGFQNLYLEARARKAEEQRQADIKREV